jgi:hypothetical protein
MKANIKEMNHQQLSELARGIQSDFVYDALELLYFLCGSTAQGQIKRALNISSEGGLTQKVSMNQVGEPGSVAWQNYIARGQKALQLLIGYIPKEELCTGYRYLEYVVSNE